MRSIPCSSSRVAHHRARHRGVKQSCEEMKRILLAQQSGVIKLPHYLTVPIGHKTGETGTVTNDVGMIYARSGTIVISFYNVELSGPRAETEDGMGRVARTVVDYFDGGQ